MDYKDDAQVNQELNLQAEAILDEINEGALNAEKKLEDFSIDVAKQNAGNGKEKKEKKHWGKPKPKRLAPSQKHEKKISDETMVVPAVITEEKELHGRQLRQDTMIVPSVPKEQMKAKAAKRAATKEKVEKKKELPPDCVTLKDVMADTVDSALKERNDGIIRQKRSPRQILWQMQHKKRQQEVDTEVLWQRNFGEEKREEVVFDEPPVEDIFRSVKKRYKHMRHITLVMGAFTCMFLGCTVSSMAGWISEEMQQSPLYPAILGVVLTFANLLYNELWRETIHKVKEKKIPGTLGVILANFVTVISCVVDIFATLQNREVMALPACMLLLFTSISAYIKAKGDFEAYYLVKTAGDPPVTLSRIEEGIVHQKAKLSGFYHLLRSSGTPEKIENVLVPILIGLTMILTGITFVQTEDFSAIAWNWSVYLCVGFPLCLGLAKTMPYETMQHFLTSKGIALAGYSGARPFKKMHRMILTEEELFPVDTVVLQGYKTFSEEKRKVLSYATSIAKACGSQLYPLLNRELEEEGGYSCQVDDIHFYEEGGVGATILGESVLMGSEFFMRKQHITVPNDLTIKTGVFLAIDGSLSCIYGIKYLPSKNVEWALRALRRNKIRPVMAVRSGNMTPPLLKRKYGLDAKPLYPRVDTRIALSDICKQIAPISGVLIYRGGVMAMVETAIGAKKMVKATTACSVLAYGSALAGMLITSYLTRVGSTLTLTPPMIVAYGLIWLIPCIFVAGFTKQI